MIFAGHDVNEAFEPGDAAEHGMHPTITFVDGHARVMGVAGEPHLVLFGHWDHAFKEISDALPVLVSVDWASLGLGRLLPGFVIYEGAVACPTSSRCRLSADDSQNTQVVF